MAVAMSEETSGFTHRGLSEWWNEETEYILRRIERWAALARGYNRLRSDMSRGGLVMEEEEEGSRWSILPNRIIIEDSKWSPRFHNPRRSHRRKSRVDENCRINCCGTFNYQSSCNLDSNCLDNYRYDHSIYFKTIGDIKSSKRESLGTDRDGTSGPEFIGFDAEDTKIYDRCEDDNDEPETLEIQNPGSRMRSDQPIEISSIEDRKRRRGETRNVWPIVDLDKLNIDVDPADRSSKIGNRDRSIPNDDCNNNDRSVIANIDKTEKMIALNINELTANQNRLDSSIGNESPQKNRPPIARVTSMRRSRRTSRKVRQPVIVGENNVSWPGVLLNYTKNSSNVAPSPHHYRAVKVK